MSIYLIFEFERLIFEFKLISNFYSESFMFELNAEILLYSSNSKIKLRNVNVRIRTSKCQIRIHNIYCNFRTTQVSPLRFCWPILLAPDDRSCIAVLHELTCPVPSKCRRTDGARRTSLLAHDMCPVCFVTI